MSCLSYLSLAFTSSIQVPLRGEQASVNIPLVVRLQIYGFIFKAYFQNPCHGGEIATPYDLLSRFDRRSDFDP